MLFGVILGFGRWDSMDSSSGLPAVKELKGCWELGVDSGICGQTQEPL